MIKKLLAIALSGLALSGTAQAAAHNGLLTFDEGTSCVTSCSNYGLLSQAYGDVAGVVDITYIDVLNANDTLRWWDANYNDLKRVAWANGSDAPGGSHGRIEVKSLNGEAVTLNSMDFGAYSDTTRNTNIRVTAIGGGAALFSYSGAVGFGTTAHNTFLPAVSSNNGLWIDWYDTAYNVGIDNVSFRIAPVPEPETYAMLLAGLALVSGIARRRKQILTT
jgi:hypothetical protein